jgi:hypothetical protein
MSFIDNLMNKLFPQKGKINEVLVHEVIKRSDKEKADFEEWKAGGEGKQWLEEFSRAYNFTKLDIQSEWSILIHQSPYSNGFALDYKPIFSKAHFQHFFDLLKERVLALNYRPSGSDRRIIQKENYIETREMHYLKPHPGESTVKANQRYGNIMIEHVSFNEKPQYIKLMANIYQDRLFTEAKNFDDFIRAILDTQDNRMD